MFKMGSHDPFGYLQHKLWQKERLGVKTGNLTPDHKKSRIGSTSVCASGVQHDVGKLSTRAATLLQPHPDWRSKHKIITQQSCKSSNLGRFGCGPRGEVQSILYGGKWWLPMSLGYGESYESKVVRGLS